MIDWKQYDAHRWHGEVLRVEAGRVLFRGADGRDLWLALPPGEPAPKPGKASAVLFIRATDADMLSPTPDEILIGPDQRLQSVTGEVKSFCRNGQEVLLRAPLPFVVEFQEYSEWLDSMIDGQVLKVPVGEVLALGVRQPG